MKSPRKYLILSLSIVTVVACILATQFTIFAVQPIGAVPDGRTLLLWRGKNMHFIDSADSICARENGGVSIMCRVLVLGEVVDAKIIIARLPYVNALYLWSTGGATYERRS